MLQMELNNRSSLDNLYINIRWMKEWRRSSLKHTGEGPLPYNTFWLVLSGSATMQFNKDVYEVKKYDIVALPAQSYHKWISLGNEGPFHYLSLACEAKVGAFDLLRLYRFPNHTTLSDHRDYEELVSLWFQLSDNFQRLLHGLNEKNLNCSERGKTRKEDYPVFFFDIKQTSQYLKIRSLGNLWVHQLFQSLQHKLPEQPVTYDNRVYDVCDYIKEHLHERPSLTELAKLVSLSKEHLRFLFQKELCLSPMKYVTQLRLQLAQELLLFTSDSMKQISDRLGYDDQHHFTRAFRREEGISPSEYRKKYKASFEYPIEL
ncbi:helix-turn-helix domain-containing protein [Paenibacillus sp. EC2-1]|uniref:helix-turn-helix domain-containing protein n=1 Tax=Paenibacillus sp. EC2-1 TaxID=3388665 RepID=UPI003BEEB9A6